MKILKNKFFLGAFLFLIASGFFSYTQKSPKSTPQNSITQTIQVSPSFAANQEVKGTSDSAVLGVFPAKKEGVIVTKVIDGDTIQLETGETVRYIGVDTPETVDPRRGVQCFGKEASQKNKELVLGKRVILEKDVSETDKYGRLLRYVYVPVTEGNSGTVFVNYQLVSDGFAYASSYPPDVRYQGQFSRAQSEAQQNNRGLWAGCEGSP